MLSIVVKTMPGGAAKLKNFIEQRFGFVDERHDDLLHFGLQLAFLFGSKRKMFYLVVNDICNLVAPLLNRKQTERDIIDVGIIRFDLFLLIG